MRRTLAAEGVTGPEASFAKYYNDAVERLTEEVGAVVSGPLADWMMEQARQTVAREEAQGELRARLREFEDSRA